MESFDDEYMEQDDGRRRGRRRGERVTQVATLAGAVMFVLAIASKAIGA